MILTIWLSYGSCWIIQISQKCLSEWARETKMGLWPFSGVWSVGSTWYFILWKHYILYNTCQRYQIKNDHLKVEKIHFGMIQRVKKYVFGHFKDFGHKLILTGGPQWFSIWGRLKTLIITFLSSLNVCLGPGWLIYFASKTWKYINIAHQDSHQSSCQPAWYTSKVMT